MISSPDFQGTENEMGGKTAVNVRPNISRNLFSGFIGDPFRVNLFLITLTFLIKLFPSKTLRS